MSIVPDPRSSTLFVAAGDADFEEIGALVREFDAPEAAQAFEFRVFVLEHARATELASTIAATGASVQDIRHERIFGGPDVSRVRVVATVEVRNADHADELLAALHAKGVRIHERVRPQSQGE